MIAMLQKKWKNLPAALRTVLTLLAVLALAALLTTVRHNASAYRTGVWDTGSQTLIYGRMHQMEQGQRAPGGFLGVYTEDWSDDQNRSWFREDTPADAAQFRPYTHQSGLQGWALGVLNRLLRVFLPEGTARETALYWVNSTLFYAVQLLTALAVWQELGVLPAAFWMAAILLAPWLQRGMKDLYWAPWTWQLPLLAPVALVLVLLLLIFCLLARRGGYRRGFREGERVVMRQMAREEQEAAVPPMPHRPAPQQPAAPKSAPQPEKAPTPPPAEEKKPAPPAAEKPASPVRETPAPAAPVSQEEKPDELDIDLLLEEIKRM